MKRSLYIIAVIFLFWSCDEEENPAVIPVRLHIKPHSSNNEFYAGVPVEFGVKANDGSLPAPGHAGIELYVDGNRVEAEFLQHSFAEPGTHQVKAVVKMFDNSTYQFDTVVNITTGPPLLGDPQRGEQVLFGWNAGNGFKMLLSSYHGSSVKDYDVLSINESLEQLGSLTRMDLGWYPEIYGYGVSASGKLALVYDTRLEIFNASLGLEHQINFSYGKVPRNILISDDSAVLLFDSLTHVSLTKVDLNSGQIVKGPTQFLGVSDMTVHDHFFLDESRIATYYVSPGNLKTLLMGVRVGGDVEFTQYFQPPVFISNVIPISSGGYVISSYISDERKLTVLGAGDSHVVKWTRTFEMNFRNFWFEMPGYRVAMRELGGFLYVFFDNMRCLKLSLDGQLIWDKYFYAEIARFEDVLITSNGEFIMLGTCRRYSNDSEDSQLQTEVLCIRINTDGFRAGI